MNNPPVDLDAVAKDIGTYITRGNLFQSVTDFQSIIKIFKSAKINVSQGSILLEECKKQAGMHRTFDLFRCCDIDFGDDTEKVLEFLLVASKSLKSKPFKELYEFIAHLQESNISLARDVQNLKSQISRLKSQGSSSHDEMLKMGTLLTDMISENSELKKEIEAKEDELRELRMNLALRDKQLKDGQTQINELYGEIKKRDEKNQNLKKKIANKDEELRTKNDQIAKFELKQAQQKQATQSVKDDKASTTMDSASGTEASKNSNLKELRSCKKDGSNFDRIYGILSKCAKENDMKTFKYALSHGFTAIKDKDRSNLMLKAAEKGNFMLVKALHENGEDIFVRDKEGWTVLHQFCQAGNLDGVKYVIQFIDVNDTTQNRWTPLHVVAYYGRVQIAEYLCGLPMIKKNELDTRKRTPLKLAQMNCEHVVAEVLRWYGCTM